MSSLIKHAGAYRLVQHIASGGMGVVYLAERDDGQVRHQAAVKILRRGLDAEDQVRRFNAERQILASLDHPSIARLIDAGITDDHRPFFVMEYVQGKPIDVYADHRRLSIRERVALIRDVALAVDYAHRQLVVHRDLKPSNIFVTADGHVKLLDFGIAKLMDAEPDATMITAPGVRLMTPGYTSPEQVVGGKITTATDVYVLGLLLYETLTGARAQDTRGLSIPEIEQLVVREAVPRPSDRVASLTAQAENETKEASIIDVTVARRTTPNRLHRLLKGDLDRIVGEALRKEPERRYHSAQAFAADLERYLEGEPVLAQGDSARYRLSKFVRRRWPMLATAAVFLLLLVAYAITVTLQAREIGRERDRMRAAQAKAEEVTSFLVRMFQASDPSEVRDEDITARELLATGVQRMDALGGQPEVQGQLLDVIGRVYQGLGKYDRAQPLLERALRVRRQALGDTHPDVAQTWTHLGELSSLQGRHAEAETRLRTALTLHQAIAGRESSASATDLLLLGTVLVDKGDRKQGKALYEEALAIRRRVLSPADPDIAESLSGLAYAASSLGDFVEMERRYSEALPILRAAFGPMHPRVAAGLNNIASALDNLGRYDEAVAMHEEALAMRRALFGEEHPAVANSLNNLARVMQRQGRFAAAVPLMRQAAALRIRLLGRDHPSTGLSLHNLAVVLHRSGDPRAAEPVMREARAIAVARLSERHPTVLTMDANLAAIVADEGRYREAEKLYKHVLDARLETLGPEHPDVASILLLYGKFLAARGRLAEAEPMLVRAHALREKLLGATHPETAAAAKALDALSRSDRGGR